MAFHRNPNQQDLSWFVDMQTQKRLELDPPYQRKSVWTYKDKQFFLDTIFNNYPCPAVYLQKENTAKGPLYNVVDGKQRLSTVLDFYAGKLRIGKDFSVPRLRGKKFADIHDDDKSHFYNYIFMVEQIRSETEVDWGEVFQRVNKNQKKLGDQELRHARFDGWLINRAEKEADGEAFWRNVGVSSRAKSARMKDVEFISILMLVLLEEDYVGFPQSHIDELYAKYDFEEDQLPENEVGLEESDASEWLEVDFTKEKLKRFEDKFSKARGLLKSLEDTNNCISKHKRRITTDLYSLWAAIVFDEGIINADPERLAAKYNEFISGVYLAYEKVKNDESIEHLDPDVQVYFYNSTGAATEVELRKKRSRALIAFLSK
ncbi:hypothetical protein A3753_11875 [Sulfitobacter sp. HI0082]|nr:hypothetical protein A3753_11875 [Sulfitobacter sp. HI0082]